MSPPEVAIYKKYDYRNKQHFQKKTQRVRGVFRRQLSYIRKLKAKFRVRKKKLSLEIINYSHS
jgi:hypothetical protein